MDERPNVVWVTLDSVRQDRTTMGGHDRDTTPRMAGLAGLDGGRAFTNCLSAGTWTLASSASILTGTYPTHHTVGIEGETVPPSLPTVAERLAESGYRTACLSRNSHISEATGLDRGFERFAWLAAPTLLQVAPWRTVVKYLLNIRRHSAGLTTDTARHATPFLMNDIGEQWLSDFAAGTDPGEGDADDPFFFYLHYNEPHRPYVPPRPWQNAYTDEIDVGPKEAIDISMDVHRTMYERVASGDPLTDRERDALLATYDAEVAYTDECVGRLVDVLRSLDTDRETLVVVTADHGELFGERGVLAHKLLLHDGLVNVPLVVWSDRQDGGFTDTLLPDADAPLGHVDVVRTLLEVAGAGTGGVQGHDLRESVPEFAIAQRAPAEFDDFTKHDPTFDTSRYHAPTMTCARTREFKFQTSDDGEELFALPDESRDASAEHPGVADDLREALAEWLATDGQPVGEARDAAFDDAMRRQLSDLGYVE
jgi:uncharacterized sulfatase